MEIERNEAYGGDMTMIIVTKKDDRVFFHVAGDNREYYDLEAVKRNHPEMTDTVEQNAYELNHQLYYLREQHNAYGGPTSAF